jgi:hypothetical protein
MKSERVECTNYFNIQYFEIIRKRFEVSRIKFKSYEVRKDIISKCNLSNGVSQSEYFRVVTSAIDSSEQVSTAFVFHCSGGSAEFILVNERL